MKRRDFVQALPALPTGLLAGASILSAAACGGVAYVQPRGTATRLRVAAASVPESGVLLQRPDMEHPVFVRADGAGGHTALLLRCTHRGCQPDPVGDRLVCPCHGSEFDASGDVLEGPAEAPLTRLQVRADGDDLVVVMGGAP